MASLCNSTHTNYLFLLQQMQRIWDEVGESDGSREVAVRQLEQECLHIYRKKLDEASQRRSRLHQSLAEAALEMASLNTLLGSDIPFMHTQLDSNPQDLVTAQGKTLRERLTSIQSQLDELRKKKEERLKHFLEVEGQIQKLHMQISGSLQPQHDFCNATDLSLRRLDEFHSHLRVLQEEKNKRLEKILEHLYTIRDLCSVLGMDFSSAVISVHPSLQNAEAEGSINMSNETLNKLAETVVCLQKEKSQRLQKIEDLGSSLMELWNLMGTPIEERLQFQHIISGDRLNAAASVLSLSSIEQVGMEVKRLERVKASRTKDLVMKKQREMEDMCRAAHMELNPKYASDKITAAIDSGLFDSSQLLASMDEVITQVKAEAHCRREILVKMECWIWACQEESWLEEYNRDENRYNKSRMAHVNLKRAEKARLTVKKIPALMESLSAKVKAWEEEKSSVPFLYDGMRVFEMLDEYKMLRQEREEEKRQFRNEKRLQSKQSCPPPRSNKKNHQHPLPMECQQGS